MFDVKNVVTPFIFRGALVPFVVTVVICVVITLLTLYWAYKEVRGKNEKSR